MKEIYLEIDGQKIKLSEDQIKFLNLEKEKNKNPFIRSNFGSKFWYIDIINEVGIATDIYSHFDTSSYKNTNYFNDKNFAMQKRDEYVLNNLLERFSYENGWSEDLWENYKIPKYYIEKDLQHNDYNISKTYKFKSLATAYFISEEIAQRAIDEIIIPFFQDKLEVKSYIKYYNG